MIYVFLADGFEECEAVAPIDILRRARLEVITVKVGGDKNTDDKKVTGSHGIEVIADIHESIAGSDGLDMIVLPGGGTGVENLYESGSVKWFIGHCFMHQIPIGAICAAPSILARVGPYLKNIRATAYPSFRHYLTEGGAVLEENAKVITDGIFTTAAAAGVSIEFGLELVRILKSEDEAKKIGEQILFY
ncbi:MAG: DJ-1/PfpI family protein [Oscillospiraceae bacterium]|nr:DJ-1/PfpI family protein [Oscillospiraceae bacterium]